MSQGQAMVERPRSFHPWRQRGLWRSPFARERGGEYRPPATIAAREAGVLGERVLRWGVSALFPFPGRSSRVTAGVSSQFNTTDVICQPERLILTAQAEAEAPLRRNPGTVVPPKSCLGPEGTVRLNRPRRVATRILKRLPCVMFDLLGQRSLQDRRSRFWSQTQGCVEAWPRLHPGLRESALQAGCSRSSNIRRK